MMNDSDNLPMLVRPRVLFRYGDTDVTRNEEGFVNLTDMWRAVGSPVNQKVAQWRRKEGFGFIEHVALEFKVPVGHLIKAQHGKGVAATWAHRKIALAYAEYLSHEFHLFVIEKFLEWVETEVRPILKPWSERFRDTLKKHLRYINVNYPECFTIATATIGSILTLEDQLYQHLLPVKSSDRPDGSIGSCWSHYYRVILGLFDTNLWAPLFLPDQKQEFMVRVYPNEVYGVFTRWFHNIYLPEKLPDYLGKKKEYREYGPLPPASVADHVCLDLIERPAQLRPKVRKQLMAMGGRCLAGQIPAAIEGPQLGLPFRS